jgi:hypothetical protein
MAKIGDMRKTSGRSAVGDQRRFWIPELQLIGVWEYEQEGLWKLVKFEVCDRSSCELNRAHQPECLDIQ